jgi:hypothetical protein
VHICDDYIPTKAFMGDCDTWLFTSPKMEELERWLKGSDSELWFMPLWTWSELQEACVLLGLYREWKDRIPPTLSEAAAKERMTTSLHQQWSMWGGSARLVMNPHKYNR